MKVFFDVDGVVIDGWHADPARRRPWDIGIEQDLGISRTALQNALFEPRSDGAGSVMRACIGGHLDLKRALAELLPSLGFDAPVDAFIDYWFSKDSVLNADVIDVAGRLAQMDGVSLYLATGQEHHRATYLWNDLGLRDHFEAMFYTARIGHLKSSPAFYAEIAAALDIKPDERPLFFDDSSSAVSSAREAGWDACLFVTVDDMRNHPRLREMLGP